METVVFSERLAIHSSVVAVPKTTMLKYRRASGYCLVVPRSQKKQAAVPVWSVTSGQYVSHFIWNILECLCVQLTCVGSPLTDLRKCD